MNEEKMKQASAYFMEALALTILDMDGWPEEKRNSSNFMQRLLFVSYEGRLRVADEQGMSVREEAEKVKETIKCKFRKIGGIMLRIELDSEDERTRGPLNGKSE